MSEYVLRTRSICKQYDNNYALQHVSVEIKRGQIYGLIGLNGAGKTTFMRTVMGLITPTSGEVELFGETAATALRLGRRRIGQSIETPALYPGMTAAQNLEIQRRMSGVPNKDSIQKTLAMVGLSNTGEKKAKNFSLGMKQRLALAVALITNPEFLILDEPVNGLDPRGIIEIRDLIIHLARNRGVTLLVSSHLLDELAQVATHYGFMHNGRLIKCLSAAELTKETRQYIEIVTKDAARAIALLAAHYGITEYKAVSAMELHIYEQLDKTGEIGAFLVRNDIMVERIGLSKQKLEEYFIHLTGGVQS